MLESDLDDAVEIASIACTLLPRDVKDKVEVNA
jgi:hypothetical protein